MELGVPAAESIGLNGGKTSAMALCTLQRPYRIPGLLPTALIFLILLGRQISWFFKSLQILLHIFLMVNGKIQNSFFDANFSKSSISW